MLRFQRDRLYVGLEPRRLTLVRRSGAWRPAVDAIESVATSAGENYCSVQELLQHELLAKRWQGTRAQVVLADSMVRYFIAPVPNGARNRQEIHQAARLRFEEIFGDDTKDWQVEIAPTPFASHHLGCAVRTDLIQWITRTCKDAGISLTGIVPFSIQEFNRHHQRIGRRSGWFAVVGPQTLWTALKSGNNWLAAHVHHLQENTVEELPSLLARETLRIGRGDAREKPFWVSGHRLDQCSAPWLKDRAVQRLGAPAWPGQNAEWSNNFRLALSSVWPACA